MKNFSVVIHEKGNKRIFYDDIKKIISFPSVIKFVDIDDNIMSEYKKDIESLEIIYEGAK